MPQPIDPNTELGRVVAAERIMQIADRASLAAQSRVTDEVEQGRLDAEQQVRETEQKSEEVDRELRRRTPFVGRRRRKKQGDKNDEAAHKFYNAAEREEIADDPEDHDFDISV